MSVRNSVTDCTKNVTILRVLTVLARPEDTSSRSLAFRPLHHG